MPEKYGLPFDVDGLRVPATDSCLSAIANLYVMGAVPVVSKRLAYLEMRMHGNRSRDSMMKSSDLPRNRRARSTIYCRNRKRVILTHSCG